MYLDDALKEGLAAAAARSGRSEADVLRDALARALRRADAPGGDGRARRPLPEGPRLVGVGVGPGDPELLTGRARQVLRRAGRVFAATVHADAVGRAEAVVRAGEPDVDVERLVLDTGPDRAARSAATAAAADRLAACLDAGELVAVAVLGDPHLWSPWPALAAAVRRRRPGTEVEAVPGVMAWQELAARTGTCVADGDERVTLVCLGDDPGDAAGAAGDAATTVVVYKGGRALPALARRLAAAGRLDGAVVGELLGQPGERCRPLERQGDRPGSYLATTIVPAERGRR